MYNLLTSQRMFPENFSAELIRVLTSMSLSKNIENVYLAGSSAVRALKYFADYDANEVYRKGKATDLQNSVQRLLKQPLCYIQEFKGGMIRDWNVIQEEQSESEFSLPSAKVKLWKLHSQSIISKEEYQEAMNILKSEDFHTIQKALRFGVIRWSAEDVLKGYVKLRNGKTFSLQQCFQDCETMKKLDVIAWIDDKFMECTMIYRQQHVDESNLKENLEKDIEYYTKSGEIFKALKRTYSLARLTKDTPTLETCVSILNSDIGILYTIVNDIEALIAVLDCTRTLPVSHIKATLSHIRQQVGFVYSVQPFLKQESSFLNHILTIEKQPSKKHVKVLQKLQRNLQNMLNKETLKQLKSTRSL